MATLTDIYPLFALQVTAGDLQLRAVRDEDIPELVALAQDGIHDPADMPFFFPWTDAPADELPINMARHYWSSRAANTRDKWSLECAVRRGRRAARRADDRHRALPRHPDGGDRVVAGQTLPWSGNRHQDAHGDLHPRLDHLDFEEVTSGAFTDNPASLGVSRKVGYRDNGKTRAQAARRRLVPCCAAWCCSPTTSSALTCGSRSRVLPRCGPSSASTAETTLTPPPAPRVVDLADFIVYKVGRVTLKT